MSEPQKKDPQVSIGASELKDILLSVIQEARKPVVTEKDLRDQAAQQEERKANAELTKTQIENKRNLQHNCSHIRRDGSTRAVFVKGSDFMICQFCQAIIKPGKKPKGDQTDHIYDTDLFNKLFQMAGAADMIE